MILLAHLTELVRLTADLEQLFEIFLTEHTSEQRLCWLLEIDMRRSLVVTTHQRLQDDLNV